MASLAALIIHAVINLITSPNHVFKTWLISPIDMFIYFIGVFVSIFSSLENGIYVTVALSVVVLLLRLARAQGRFVGRVRFQQYPPSLKRNNQPLNSSSASLVTSDPTLQPEVSERDAFLPLDRAGDPSNPLVDIEAPPPGIFIYRFSEGFNYLNQAQYIDTLVGRVMEETRRTTMTQYAHPGDRPWNEPAPAKTSKLFDDQPDPELTKPTLRAIILDFSTVNNVDSGAIEGLVDMRAQLNRWAAPEPVEWHFANVRSRWTRRALAVAGFGYPSRFQLQKKLGEGGEEHWEPVFSLAEKGGGFQQSVKGGRDEASHMPKIPEPTAGVVEKEGGDSTKTPPNSRSSASSSHLAALYGINRPRFHVDLTAALEAATRSCCQSPTACEDAHEGVMSDSASMV